MSLQNIYRFHDMICSNLLYAKPEVTQAKLARPYRAASIHDFISGLSDSFGTLVTNEANACLEAKNSE